ncbi:MAG TPA: type 3 dihydrofolate reductase [Candidatus Competibacteraceae bacterium]|nr:type 3 dihydrofolate reductase [Candidatus Competibacteraceae bacterium]
MTMKLTLVVAVARNGVIGRNNGLPWHLPNDLKFFKQTTLGKPVIMGRKTYQSIGRPLPGRQNIVVTHDPEFQAPGCQVVLSLDAALKAAAPAPEVMLIGGASLYAQTLPRAERIYLTWVDAEPQGDAWFPELEPEQWREVWREDHPADAHHEHAYSFRLLERVHRGQ